MNRKSFLTSVAVIGTAGMANAMQTETKPLLHHVFFWLNNPGSASDKQQLIEGLKTLSAIPTVRQLHIGVLASTEKREVVDTSWDVSELMFFDEAAGQKVYQDHPIHQAFVKQYSHLWKKVVVYDAIDI